MNSLREVIDECNTFNTPCTGDLARKWNESVGVLLLLLLLLLLLHSQLKSQSIWYAEIDYMNLFISYEILLLISWAKQILSVHKFDFCCFLHCLFIFRLKKKSKTCRCNTPEGQKVNRSTWCHPPQFETISGHAHLKILLTHQQLIPRKYYNNNKNLEVIPLKSLIFSALFKSIFWN